MSIRKLIILVAALLLAAFALAALGNLSGVFNTGTITRVPGDDTAEDDTVPDEPQLEKLPTPSLTLFDYEIEVSGYGDATFAKLYAAKDATLSEVVLVGYCNFSGDRLDDMDSIWSDVLDPWGYLDYSEALYAVVVCAEGYEDSEMSNWVIPR